MTLGRKDFLRKVCISGACLCGFGKIAVSETQATVAGAGDNPDDKSLRFIQEWIANLLENMGSQLDEDSIRGLLKETSKIHYQNLNMDEILSSYIDEPGRFISFLEEEWGWIIDYDRENNTIVADENKNNCVCPILDRMGQTGSPLMCYCSEGFAERMFSKVLDRPVTASVISSIRKGDNRCRYRIVIAPGRTTG